MNLYGIYHHYIFISIIIMHLHCAREILTTENARVMEIESDPWSYHTWLMIYAFFYPPFSQFLYACKIIMKLHSVFMWGQNILLLAYFTVLVQLQFYVDLDFKLKKNIFNSVNYLNYYYIWSWDIEKGLKTFWTQCFQYSELIIIFVVWLTVF